MVGRHCGCFRRSAAWCWADSVRRRWSGSATLPPRRPMSSRRPSWLSSTAAGAAVVRRLHDDPLLCVPLSLVAVIFAATAGFLAVPAGPPASAYCWHPQRRFRRPFLLRLIGCGTILLTAIATATVLIAAVAASGVTWGMAPDAGGAALPRCRLRPWHPHREFRWRSAAPARDAQRRRIADPDIDGDDRAGLCSPDVDRTGQRAISPQHSAPRRLPSESSATAARRSASPCPRPSVWCCCFARAPTSIVSPHRSCRRRSALCHSMFRGCCRVDAPPMHIGSGLAAAAGAAALGSLLGLTVSPVVPRTVEIIDYLAIAAVVPMACWVGGLYGFVRGMNLL